MIVRENVVNRYKSVEICTGVALLCEKFCKKV